MQDIIRLIPSFISELELEFGLCQGMMIGYNNEHKSHENGWRWCAAVLPGAHMASYMTARSKTGKKDPFLIVLGSSLDAAKRGGVPHAFYGIGLLANINLQATDLLHPDQMNDRRNLNSLGKFKWPTGAPLLRVWQPPVPIPFTSLLGRSVSFNQAHGTNLFDIDNQAIKGIRPALATIGLYEADMVRPQPIPDAVVKLLKKMNISKNKLSALVEQNSFQSDHKSCNPTDISSNHLLIAKVNTDAVEENDKEIIRMPSSIVSTIEKLPHEQQESAFQKLEAERISGVCEVDAGLGGRCDILTETEVVEVKRYSHWRHALGQVLSYGHFFPTRDLRIHLFDCPLSPEKEISVICGIRGVSVSYIIPD